MNCVQHHEESATRSTKSLPKFLLFAVRSVWKLRPPWLKLFYHDLYSRLFFIETLPPQRYSSAMVDVLQQNFFEKCMESVTDASELVFGTVKMVHDLKG